MSSKKGGMRTVKGSRVVKLNSSETPNVDKKDDDARGYEHNPDKKVESEKARECAVNRKSKDNSVGVKGRRRCVFRVNSDGDECSDGKYEDSYDEEISDEENSDEEDALGRDVNVLKHAIEEPFEPKTKKHRLTTEGTESKKQAVATHGFTNLDITILKSLKDYHETNLNKINEILTFADKVVGNDSMDEITKEASEKYKKFKEEMTKDVNATLQNEIVELKEKFAASKKLISDTLEKIENIKELLKKS